MHDLLNGIKVSEKLDDVINESMSAIKKERKRKKLRHTIALGMPVLMLGAGVIFCMNNVSFASALPIVGNIFSRMSGKTDYLGDLSDNVERLVAEDEIEQMEQSENVDSPYVQTSNGITIALTEVAYDKSTLYFGVSIQSEEPFDEGIMYMKNEEDYQLNYDVLHVEATATSDNLAPSPDGGNTFSPYEIEGNFTDANTFIGIMPVDIAMREDGKKELGPDAFQYDLTIKSIWTLDMFDDTTTQVNGPDGEIVDMPTPRKITYSGEWNYQVDVDVNDTNIETVEVDGQNENGIGISSVHKTPFTLYADLLLPENADEFDYIIVMCDANGDKLEYQGHNSSDYSFYGKDVSTVYVFVCDAIEYLDELKGYYFSPDYEEKKKTKTFAQYLQERALFSTEVHFANPL